MAISLSLEATERLVDDVECVVVVDVWRGTAEGDDEQPDNAVAAANTPVSNAERVRRGWGCDTG
jgi:hypothetical protein